VEEEEEKKNGADACLEERAQHCIRFLFVSRRYLSREATI